MSWDLPHTAMSFVTRPLWYTVSVHLTLKFGDARKNHHWLASLLMLARS